VFAPDGVCALFVKTNAGGCNTPPVEKKEERK
jgi:hypothetical protein